MPSPASADRMASIFPETFDGTPLNQWASQGVLVAVFALEEWGACVADAFEILDTRERERVLRQRRPADRSGLTLAYALHRLLLSRITDVPVGHVPLARDTQGRPVLESMAIDTSLSHSDGYVAVAVSADGPVGVDIEPVHRAAVMPEIAGRICHGDESLRMAAHDETTRGRALLDLWVRKEAFLKAAGVGLAREMDTFALAEGETHALHHGSAENVVVDLTVLGPDVACAVARVPGSVCAAGWLRPVQG